MTYDDLRSANPYSNPQYKKSWWQKFVGDTLGFRTKYDAYMESMALNEREYNAEVANKEYNEKYESPSAEAQRMRGAGMNPDLQGIGDVAGASAPDIGDENPPIAPEAEGGDLMQFGQFCMSALVSGFSLAKDFGSLKALHIANQAGQLENSEKVSRFADWLAHQLYLSPEQSEKMAVDFSTGDEEYFRNAYTRDLNDQFFRQIPKRFRRQFERNLTTAMNSFDVRGEMFKKASEYVQNRSVWAKNKASRFYSEGQGDGALLDVVLPLARLSDDVAEATLKFQKNKADFDKSLYDRETGLNPETIASSQNTIALNEGQNASLNYMINKTFKEIIDNLSTRSKKGDIFAQSMLFSFSLMRMSNLSLTPKGLNVGFNPSF